MSLSSRYKRFLRYFGWEGRHAFSFVRRYLERSRFRTCRFIVDSEVACWERSIWFALIALGAFCVVFLSCIISLRYNANYLTTVTDNTHHTVADVPFPAVTLCHYNRIDLRKVDAAIDRFLPNSSHFEQKLLRVLFQRLNTLRFGSFGKLNLREDEYRSLDHLNLSALFEFTTYSCENLLRECWWRSREIECCDLFSMSKSEYGFCYSFNSQAAPMSQYEKDHTDLAWPLQTHRYGIGTGLRVVYGIDWNGYKERGRRIGATVIVHGNGEWPTNGRFIPAGNAIEVAIEPTLYKTSKKLRGFSPLDRQCYFDDAWITDEITAEVLHLKDLPYLKSNCVVECRRYHMMKYCNCSVNFFYPDYGYPPCGVIGLQCLSYFNSILTYDKPRIVSPFFSQREVGIDCKCLPECIRVEYKYTVKPNYMWSADNDSIVDFSIFFKRQGILRYRTEKAYQFQFFLSNIGGIFSFFFGTSLLSLAEIIFFITSSIISKIKRWKSSGSPNKKIVRRTITVGGKTRRTNTVISHPFLI